MTTRPEQPTGGDPDPSLEAIRKLLSSTRAQTQAAGILREAGWTVHEKWEVERLQQQLAGLKCQAKDDAKIVAGWMSEVECMRPVALEAEIFADQARDFIRAVDTYRAAVETALKEQTDD